MFFDWSALEKLENIGAPDTGGFIVSKDLCAGSFGRDYSLVQTIAPLVFAPVPKSERTQWARLLATQFISWRHDYPPTLPALLAVACDEFMIDTSHALIKPALAACILGEIFNDNQFHNPHHFREVMTLVLRFCATHNRLDENADHKLSETDILLLITAAAIHDFTHDGETNTVDGKHIPGRLEKQAFERAKPFLEQAGMAKADLNIVEQLVMATDASIDSSGQSPSGWVRTIGARQYGQLQSVEKIPESYQIFENDPKLTLMTLTLCEADIAPSSSLDYSFSKLMTINLAAEDSRLKASAETLHGFMDRVCNNELISPAPRYLLMDNFARIQKEADQDRRKDISFG